MGVRVLMVVSMISLWFVMSPTSTYACSCAPPGTPAEALAHSDLVFRGMVTSIEPGDDEHQLAVQFDVQTVWKGANTDTITLATQQDTAACGYPFEAGVEYVVYSYDGSDVARCSRTAPVELAAEDLAAFSGGAQAGGATDFPNTGGGGLAADEPGQDRLAALLVVVAAGTLALGFAGVRLYVRRQARADDTTNVDQT